MEKRSEAERKQPNGGKGADGRQVVGWVSGWLLLGGLVGGYYWVGCCVVEGDGMPRRIRRGGEPSKGGI